MCRQFESDRGSHFALTKRMRKGIIKISGEKMIYKNAELYGVTELEKRADKEGFVCLRMPAFVRDTLETGMSELLSRASKTTEIRFVMLGDQVKIKLAKFEKGDRSLHSVFVFYGGIQGAWYDHCVNRHLQGDVDEIIVEKPKNMDTLKRMAKASNDPFSPEVVRVIFNGGYYTLLDIDGDIRPPKKSETPMKTLMTYGSSITQGSNSMDSAHSWASWVAHELDMDLLNHAMAGSCAMEPAFVDFIAQEGEQGKWDIGVLELGINVLYWEDSKILERVKNTIVQIAGRNKDKPIYVISPFYCDDDFNGKTQADKWRQYIKAIVAELHYENVTYINGLDLLGNVKYLSADEVHPNVYGCQKIANGLLEIIKK